MGTRKRYSVTLGAVFAWLIARPSARPRGLQRIAARLIARLWRRRLSLLGLLLLTVGGTWIKHGLVAGGGWGNRLLQAVVCVEVILIGVVLLRSDLGRLAQRILHRQIGRR